MAASIFEVQVNDEAFKRFEADFGKYTIAVGELPMAWGRIEAAIAKVGTGIEAQTDALSKVIRATAKATDGQRDYNQALRETAGTWGSIVHWTRMAMTSGTQLLGIYGAIASRVTSAAVSLLRWGTVGALGAGLAGAGGLWGISNLASAAGATRRASQGLGLGEGELRAYETNFAKMFDPRGVLGNISSARNDPDRRWALISMGLDPNASTGELGLQAPARAKAIYEEGGQSLSYARARGLLEVFTEEDLQRLHAMTVQEIDASRQMVEQDRRRMAVSDALARRWQNLAVQFDRAGQVIQTIFLDALGPLAPEIEKLSDAFTEAVKTALSLEGMRTAINWLATGIRTAGEYIGSAGFLDDIRKFGEAVEAVWRAVARVAAWINGLFPGTGAGGVRAAEVIDRGGIYTVPEYGSAAWASVDMNDPRYRSVHRPMPRPDYSLGSVPGVDQTGIDPWAWLTMGQRGGGGGGAGGSFSEIEARRGLPPGLLDRVWQQESGRGRHMLSSAGAQGHFQFMPATGAQYGLTRPEHFNDLGRSSEAAGQYMQDLLRQFGGDLAKAAAAYNWGPRRVEQAVATHGDNWRLHAPRETQQYLAAVVDPIIDRLRREAREGRGGTAAGQTPPRIDVRIDNQTGARVAVTGAAVRAQ